MTTTIPDALPFLSAGGHASAKDGACAMEYLSILAGEQFSDQPTCTDYQLGYIVQSVNDTVSDDARQQLLSILHKALGTNVFTLREPVKATPEQEANGIQFEDSYTHEIVDVREYALVWRDLANAMADSLFYGDTVTGYTFQSYIAGLSNFAAGDYVSASAQWHEAVKGVLFSGRRPSYEDKDEQREYDNRLIHQLDNLLKAFRSRAGIKDEGNPIDLKALEALRLELVSAL